MERSTVAGIRAHVDHLRPIHHLHIVIRHQLVLDRIGLARSIGGEVRGACQDQDFRLQQRLVVEIRDGLPLVVFVLGQQVADLVVADQIEAPLLILGHGLLGLCLPFGPDIIEARLGLIRDVVAQAIRRAAAHRVQDPGHGDVGSVRAGTAGAEFAGIVGLLNARLANRVDGLGQPARVDDRDPANAVRGRVDMVQHEIIPAVVGDRDVGVAVCHLDPSIARTENLTGEDHFSAFGDNVFDDNVLALGIEVTVDRNSLGTEAHARDRMAVDVQQRHGLRGGERGTDVEGHRLHAALDQAVDVQILGRDGNPPLSHNLRFVRVDRIQDGLLERCGQLVERLRDGRTAFVKDQRANRIVVDVIAGILVAVVPALGVQVEVLRSGDVHRCPADLAGNVDAPLGVGDRHSARLIDHIAHQVEILVVVGQFQTGQVVLAQGQRILADRDRRRRLRRAGQRMVIAVDVTGLQDRILSVDNRHPFVVQHDRIFDYHRERRSVVDHNLRIGVGDQLGPHERLQRGFTGAVGLNEDRARRHGDRGDFQEQEIQFLLHHSHLAGGIVRVGHIFQQPQLGQGCIDRFELDLIPRHGLRIVGMVRDPRKNPCALRHQKRAKILVTDPRRRHIDRLDHEELAGQLADQ